MIPAHRGLLCAKKQRIFYVLTNFLDTLIDLSDDIASNGRIYRAALGTACMHASFCGFLRRAD